MPLRFYDSRDLVPEAQRAAAVETKEGKFVVEEVDPALGDAGKKALEKERERADAADKAKARAEKELADLKLKADASAAGVSEQQLQQIRESEAATRKPIIDENETLKSENRKLKLTDRVQALFLKYGGMTDRIEDAMTALDKRTDLTSDGKGIVVKDKTGNVTAETIDNFLEKTFRAEKPWLYKGTGASGSGASGTTAAGDPPPEAPPKNTKRRDVAGAF